MEKRKRSGWWKENKAKRQKQKKDEEENDIESQRQIWKDMKEFVANGNNKLEIETSKNGKIELLSTEIRKRKPFSLGLSDSEEKENSYHSTHQNHCEPSSLSVSIRTFTVVIETIGLVFYLYFIPSSKRTSSSDIVAILDLEGSSENECISCLTNHVGYKDVFDMSQFQDKAVGVLRQNELDRIVYNGRQNEYLAVMHTTINWMGSATYDLLDLSKLCLSFLKF